MKGKELPPTNEWPLGAVSREEITPETKQIVIGKWNDKKFKFVIPVVVAHEKYRGVDTDTVTLKKRMDDGSEASLILRKPQNPGFAPYYEKVAPKQDDKNSKGYTLAAQCI